MNINNNLFENKYIRLLAMSLVIIVALIFVQDFGDFLDENSNNAVKLGGNPNCNSVTSICSASIVNDGDFQRISFAVNSETISEKEIAVTLNAVGFDFEGIDSISVVFEMSGEDIEPYRVSFTPDKSLNQVVPEKWDAKIKLPVVSSGRGDWLAVVSLKSSKKEYHAEFPFQLLKRIN